MYLHVIINYFKKLIVNVFNYKLFKKAITASFIFELYTIFLIQIFCFSCDIWHPFTCQMHTSCWFASQQTHQCETFINCEMANLMSNCLPNECVMRTVCVLWCLCLALSLSASPLDSSLLWKGSSLSVSPSNYSLSCSKTYVTQKRDPPRDGRW